VTLLLSFQKSEFKATPCADLSLFFNEKNTVQCQEWLEKHYSDSAPSKRTICYWYAEFKRGRTDTDDIPSTGRPNDAVFPENVEKTLKIIMSDHKVKVKEIADILKISAGSVHTIIHEHLGMKKLFSKWVPRLLTVEQKQQRIDDSERCLELFNRNKMDFLRRYVTMDETWIHHYTPELKRQSSEWTGPGESRPKRPKTQQSAGKVMASVFWDTHGILFIDYLEKGKTINSDYYCALLDRLKDEIALKRPHMKKKKILFHQDNAPCHKSIKRWSNSMKCTSNFFRIHRIVQIWPPATTGSSQTSKICSVVRDLAQMMK